VGWAKSRSPRVPGKNLKNLFPVTVKIRTSGYQTLECFIATLPNWGEYGRLVHVGETFHRSADFGCELHKYPLRPDWSAVALPRPTSRYKGREGRGRKGLGIGKLRVGKDVKG